jgi:DNA modification methylase
VVLDPFCGAGTTVIAAAKHGNPVIGVDLDPFSSLLSRAAIATNADLNKVASLLETSKNSDSINFPEEARELFSEADLAYAASLFTRLNRALNVNGSGILGNLLDDPSGLLDSEVIALTAIGVAANESARVVRGSNPVWYRRPIAGEPKRPDATLASATKAAMHIIMKDLKDLQPRLTRREARIFNADSRTLDLPDSSIDLVLTSPPYLNRLDYVVNHLAPLALLNGLIDFSLDSMRKEMIGTTKIVDKGRPPSPEWGPLCLETLNRIASHPSKASQTYYYWNFDRYFRDLSTIITLLRRVCKKGARGLIVIQNSYYKDLVIPVPEIIIEMGRSVGLSVRVVRREAARTHLGTINPHQMGHAPKKILQESVLLLEVPITTL